MKPIYKFLIVSLLTVNISFAQNVIKGKIFDSTTKEPVVGASVKLDGTNFGTTTSVNGQFSFETNQKVSKITISSIGFETQVVDCQDNKPLSVSLEPSVENLQQVVVTANREASLRTQSPVAISKLSPTLINDTKATNMYEIINKTPGVVMVNLGNEQHMMSIRQPMGTNPYFLYMEDGLPIRPMGVFNHNALLEMNTFVTSSIEVVKGPASSLYGPEAVGGAINVITQRPTSVSTARVGVQFDSYGYKRIQFGAGAIIGKLGVYLGGYVTKQRESWMTNSDFDKQSFMGKLEYTFNDKTRLIGAISYIDYNSQSGGGGDSISYYSRSYTSVANFAYRRALATRARISLEHTWNNDAQTTITPYYRDNSLGQNPNYTIIWKQGASTATSQINDNSFTSYGVSAQHSQHFSFLKTNLLVGGIYDYSTNPYYAYLINLSAQLRPDGKSVEKYTVSKEEPTNFLSKYDAKIYNTGIYTQIGFEPLQNLRFSLGLRYDRMAFDYVNYLAKTASGEYFSGTKEYSQVTPKIGFTYDLGHGKGFYANYSKGFSPPALTAIFRKRPTPAANGDLFYYNLEPAHFDNYEVGGWASLLNNKIYIDYAFYQMDGQNELLSIKQPDNSTDYQSVGKTLHRGVEYGITYKPNAQWLIRFGGTNAVHRFMEFTLSNKASDVLQNVNGKDMPQAPKWIANTEVTYKPTWLKNYRVSIEWQRISSWYQNQINTVSYDDTGAFGAKGVSFLNFRTGYQWKSIELYLNVMNLTNELYATNATRGNNATDRTTYTPAAPRTFVVGFQYNFVGKK